MTRASTHLAHHSWSQGLKSGHNYRIITDIVVDGWANLKAVTMALAEDINLEVDKASWGSQAFYLPSVDPERREQYATITVLTEEGTSWTTDAQPEVRKRPSKGEPGEMDVAEVREALEYIENAEYHLWIAIGQAPALDEPPPTRS